ncbi:hypothetical protein LJC20_02775 [Eubacteriales bacterium OttesenSCG-928-M02]|nr:hypothetical protein [Eubacteriales bacterium OttesenSCG-928-M02]
MRESGDRYPGHPAFDEMRMEMLKKAHGHPHREGKLPKPMLLIIIVDWDRAKRVTDLLRQLHIPSHFQIHAEGTASSDTLDYLGLGASEKAVILSIVPHWTINELMSLAADKLRLSAPGRGIAFTLPISSITNRMLRQLGREEQIGLNKRIESEVNQMMKESTHGLIMAIVKRGYSEELMDAARAAGATGGTVIHTRHMGLDESAKKLWGISVQEESELVLILAAADAKKDIMRAISQSCGPQCEAGGTIFSLPVDSVLGLEI